MVVPPTALANLRKKLRNRRQDIANKQNNAKFVAGAYLYQAIASCNTVGLYHPMSGEPDPLPLLANFLGLMSLPCLSQNPGAMHFRVWKPGVSLVTSPWGGVQPSASAALACPDLIFVPLLAFDIRFNRIGQGGGHYDRYLAAHPSACRIGVAWEGQRLPQIDAQPWDVPMDAIITETAFHVKDLKRCRTP